MSGHLMAFPTYKSLLIVFMFAILTVCQTHSAILYYSVFSIKRIGSEDQLS